MSGFSQHSCAAGECPGSTLFQILWCSHRKNFFTEAQKTQWKLFFSFFFFNYTQGGFRPNILNTSSVWLACPSLKQEQDFFSLKKRNINLILVQHFFFLSKFTQHLPNS